MHTIPKSYGFCITKSDFNSISSTACLKCVTVPRMYHDEIKHLGKHETKDLVSEFFKLAFMEDSGQARFVMAIVHGSARYLPDLLEYMAEKHPNLTVKSGLLSRSSDLETTTLAAYNESVRKHYESGTVRYGPLHQVSLVGTAHEEVGGYFPDLLSKLEENPFLKMVSVCVFCLHSSLI